MRQNLILSIFIILPLFALLFQNCSQIKSIIPSEKSTLSIRKGSHGNAPAPDMSQSATCQPGSKLALWADQNKDGQKDELLGYIVAYRGQESAAKNYNLYKNSAYPKIGPKPKTLASHIYFYDGPEGLSFNFFHNVDNDNPVDNKIYWDIFIKNNNFADQLLLSDDPDEVKTESRSANSTYYKAYVHYKKNTDGGVIGPFTTKNVEIKVTTAQGKGNMSDSIFYSANGDIYSLGNKKQLDSFIITYDSVETCAKK